MKVTVVFGAESRTFDVREQCTVGQLQDAIRSQFDLQRAFHLTLGAESAVLDVAKHCTLQELNVGDGRTIHVILDDEDDDASAKAMADFESIFRQLVRNAQFDSAVKLVVAIAHSAFMANKFTYEDGSQVLPDNWNSLASAGFYKFRLKVPKPPNLVEITLTEMSAAKERVFVEARLLDKSQLKFGSNVKLRYDFASAKPEHLYESAKRVFKQLQREIITCLTVGRRSDDICALPPGGLRQIFKYLNVTDFINATSTCKTLLKYQSDQEMWKHFMNRDFPVIYQNLSSHGELDWKNHYMHHYKSRPKRRQRTVPTPNSATQPQSQPGPYRPQPTPAGNTFPGIGGPNDLNPIGPNVVVPELFPHPFAPSRPGMGAFQVNGGNFPMPLPGEPQPRGPRYDPPFPIDPEHLIRLPGPGRPPFPPGPGRGATGGASFFGFWMR